MDSRQFVGLSGNYQFAADVVRNPMFLAERDHGARSFNAELRFERSRLVIDSRMNNSAVMTALVPSNAWLFLDQKHAQIRKGLGQV